MPAPLVPAALALADIILFLQELEQLGGKEGYEQSNPCFIYRYRIRLGSIPGVGRRLLKQP